MPSGMRRGYGTLPAMPARSRLSSKSRSHTGAQTAPLPCRPWQQPRMVLHSPLTTPGRSAPMHCLDVILVLSEEASQVLEHLDSFKYIPMYREGTSKGERQSNCRFALDPPICSDRAAFRPPMPAYRWTRLHPAVSTSRVTPPLLLDVHFVPKMKIPKVTPHVPPILQNPSAAIGGAL